MSLRKVERPERNLFKKQVRTMPWVKIAKIYEVSDKAIVKWCKQYNLPFKKSEIRKISNEDWENI